MSDNATPEVRDPSDETRQRCSATVKGSTTIQRIATFGQCPNTATHVSTELHPSGASLDAHLYCSSHAAGAKRRRGMDSNAQVPVDVRRLGEPTFVPPEGLLELLGARERARERVADAERALDRMAYRERRYDEHWDRARAKSDQGQQEMHLLTDQIAALLAA